MTILILDRLDDENDRRASLRAAVERAAVETPTIHLHNAGQGNWVPLVPADVSAELVLFHWSDSETLNNAEMYPHVRPPIDRAKVRVAYSGGGIGVSEHLPDGWYRIPRPMQKAQDVSTSEWRELLLWAADPSRPTEQDRLPRVLRADFPRVATALLILCQGFMAMTQGFDVSSSAASRVRTPEWWAEPFKPIADIDKRLQEELGESTLSVEIMQLVHWFRPPNPQSNGASVMVPGNLNNLIEKAEQDLAKSLGASSM